MSSFSLSGRRLGAYEVGPLIGAGGMGEVYRAHDSKLNRDVAIKTLLPAVAADSERLARFRREAQVLASLNHPNIAHIHGIEESETGPFLVMELVDGPTLADRISQGAIPIDESINIAKQIADALEAAHERGIIHRDLKPANIKVSDDGVVKVLDFGLAKALNPGTGTGEPGTDANSPTITSPAMTIQGLILGTAAYMSPEQAKGRAVDKRTDIWAFGCVLFEMLAAKRAFDGEDVTEAIAAVVRGEPDWNALPPETPAHIRLLIKRCLEKDRRARASDIAVARFLMAEGIAPPPAAISSNTSWRRMSIAAALGVLAGALLIAGVARQLWPEPAVQRVRRFEVVLPSARPLNPGVATDHNFAVSPDGARIVYRAIPEPNVPVQLYLRSLDSLDAKPISGTAGARNPFFSPDGRTVAFFAGSELRKVSINGGGTQTICKLQGNPRGGYWAEDGTIVFATIGPGLQRVAEGGGDPEQLLPVNATLGGERFPVVLPGARAVVFTSGPLEGSQIEVLDLKTRQRKVLINLGTDAAYAKTGHLVFAIPGSRDTETLGALRAVRFDAARLEVTGESVPVVEQVPILVSGVAEYALSDEGTLVVSNTVVTARQGQKRSLVWVNRRGVEESLGFPEREYAVARISPDGLRIAADVRDPNSEIVILEINRKTSTTLNPSPAQDMSPIWTPNGKRIIWTSTRGGSNPNLLWQAADGTGVSERLSQTINNQFPTSMTPDGSQVLYFGGSATAPANRMDLHALAVGGADRKPRPLIQSPAMELDPELSPDGRWLAYHSDESGGTQQVFVRPYPDVDSGRTQISTTGGTRAAWSRTGRELFYLDENGMLTSVIIEIKGDVFSAMPPKKVLNVRYYPGSTSLGLDLRAYDVSPDGQRFLMIKESGTAVAPETPAPVQMLVTLNWFTELNTRAPVKP